MPSTYVVRGEKEACLTYQGLRYLLVFSPLEWLFKNDMHLKRILSSKVIFKIFFEKVKGTMCLLVRAGFNDGSAILL